MSRFNRIKLRYTNNFKQTTKDILNAAVLAVPGLIILNTIDVVDGAILELQDKDITYKLLTTEAQESLKSNSLIAITPEWHFPNRTIFATHIERMHIDYSHQEIIQEIQHRNNVQIDRMHIINPNNNNGNKSALKITLHNAREADKLINKGISLFHSIIPPTNISKERFFNIRQCYICFGFDHFSNTCRKSICLCSICGKEHHYKHCPNPHQPFCINCSGLHHAVSNKCPLIRDIFQQMEKSSRGANPLPQNNINSGNSHGRQPPPPTPSSQINKSSAPLDNAQIPHIPHTSNSIQTPSKSNSNLASNVTLNAWNVPIDKPHQSSELPHYQNLPPHHEHHCKPFQETYCRLKIMSTYAEMRSSNDFEIYGDLMNNFLSDSNMSLIQFPPVTPSLSRPQRKRRKLNRQSSKKPSFWEHSSASATANNNKIPSLFDISPGEPPSPIPLLNNNTHYPNNDIASSTSPSIELLNSINTTVKANTRFSIPITSQKHFNSLHSSPSPFPPSFPHSPLSTLPHSSPPPSSHPPIFSSLQPSPSQIITSHDHSAHFVTQTSPAGFTLSAPPRDNYVSHTYSKNSPSPPNKPCPQQTSPNIHSPSPPTENNCYSQELPSSIQDMFASPMTDESQLNNPPNMSNTQETPNSQLPSQTVNFELSMPASITTQSSTTSLNQINNTAPLNSTFPIVLPQISSSCSLPSLNQNLNDHNSLSLNNLLSDDLNVTISSVESKSPSLHIALSPSSAEECSEANKTIIYVSPSLKSKSTNNIPSASSSISRKSIRHKKRHSKKPLQSDTDISDAESVDSISVCRKLAKHPYLLRKNDLKTCIKQEMSKLGIINDTPSQS